MLPPSAIPRCCAPDVLVLLLPLHVAAPLFLWLRGPFYIYHAWVVEIEWISSILV
ncbi:hypothetical protein RchiOBHm_Chr7g0210951 [Rosa chinensis]|uniref:Uncharacterized protein n=1 Tax=Rosa chinensis TaxID=74649 RepID=A0A2P6PAC0_ROSCH|nr:hypothetical protein RchiOBHm_Chr7g0210951 [Rosa chinensis]